MFLHTTQTTHGRMAQSSISEQKSAQEGAGSIHLTLVKHLATNGCAKATFQLEGLIILFFTPLTGLQQYIIKDL